MVKVSNRGGKLQMFSPIYDMPSMICCDFTMIFLQEENILGWGYK